MFKPPLKPGLVSGLYPQKQDTWPDALETMARACAAKTRQLLHRHRYTLAYIVKQVNHYEPGLSGLSDADLQSQAQNIRSQLQRQGLQDGLVFQAFAILREACFRVLGKRHYDVQLLGAWVMVNGMVAEMATGEGKTLTAALTACTAAMAGIPVHVVTANDYLASRDEQLLRPLYEWLGLSSATVIDGMATELRMQAYQCAIVHATSQQIAFDYLRDRMAMGNNMGNMQIQFQHIHAQHQQKSLPFLLRGLCFTLIDEADSLLIDEAKTPLIISQTLDQNDQRPIYYDALYLAAALTKNTDFINNEKHQELSLTPKGKARLADLSQPLGPYWQQRRQREFIVSQALKATYHFHRDQHYLVRDNKVIIIDTLTGRLMPDRSWEQGLHQLIEAKEGCDITGAKETIARISFQKFFKRYLRLAGMSGTLKEVAPELLAVYGLQTINIPTHKPSRRLAYPEKVYKTAEQKWQAFIEKTALLHRQGQPLLIGTRTVTESEHISALLTARNLPHQVLNADQDQHEADIIARAGQLHSITVATNMAGRGTDIALGPGAEALGGLHVIITARNDARRIDRQLYGRCARQGDPGSSEGFMSLEDENIVNFYPPAMLNLLRRFCLHDDPLPNWLANIVLSLPQKWTEAKHANLRKLLLKQEQELANTLAFTGRME